MTTPQEKAAIDFITRALPLRSGASERAVIENLVASLRSMFPDAPAWIDAHIREAEAQVKFADDAGKARSAFIDNLVGYTTIEYERDLGNQALFKTGYRQVKEHVAGLVNAGAPQDKILGVLSDTLHWRAYRIKKMNARGPTIGPLDIELAEVEQLDVSGASKRDAEQLIDFLSKYLGRESALHLAALAVALDLGFDSTFGKRYLTELAAVVDQAFTAEPKYAKVIEGLWASFIGAINEASSAQFDRALYISELYVVTLAKLLCANIIARKGLNSTDKELAAILGGEHFRAKGLENLVEYDYFGWLNTGQRVDKLVPIARAMQRGLRSYDFESPAPEDLFGLLLAQLAIRSQRLLLGQEATPPWLAARIARQLVAALPKNRQPRFLDMCCGSGSMLIEVVKLAKARHSGAPDQDDVLELSQVATGFDIDPLAVLLAKVNWVIAARDWLEPFDGSYRVSIPVYQADSLFVTTALGDTDKKADTYSLELHGKPVALPAFLVRPESRALFDALLDRAYSIGMTMAQGTVNAVDSATLDIAVDEAADEAGATLDAKQRKLVLAFLKGLIERLATLQRQRLNGIWAFVLRNSYRPGLVVGQFNGLISNPPWLALSKLADNPYRKKLDAEADTYAVTPRGPAHLHTELATTFVLHAVDRYLKADAVVGVILPDTITNGFQHEPFRRGAYAKAKRPVDFDIPELWRVAPGTFKNEAVVTLGKKAKRVERRQFSGALVAESGLTPLRFQVIKLADNRTAWSDTAGATSPRSFDDIAVRQGADIMPRRAIFFETQQVAGSRNYTIAPIDTPTSKSRYLLQAEKRLTDFTISATSVPDRFMFDVLLSKHLVPFHVATPAKALLPIERSSGGTWQAVTTTKLAASPAARAAFDEILTALGEGNGAIPLNSYFELLDTRRKLTQQRLPNTGYLFVQGAGGAFPCAAYESLANFDADRLIIDQTLYWAVVDDGDEAVYLTGLFNSDALNRLISEFQPQGAFGRRHVHELPASVTPGFDTGNNLHVAVVSATKQLMSEYATAAQRREVALHFDPNRGLPQRRAKLREVIRSLPSFAQYDTACQGLYTAVAAARTP